MKTIGLNPKVPVQAIVTIIVAAASYLGVELSPEISGALGILIGFAAGYLAPAAPVQAA